MDRIFKIMGCVGGLICLLILPKTIVTTKAHIDEVCDRKDISEKVEIYGGNKRIEQGKGSASICYLLNVGYEGNAYMVEVPADVYQVAADAGFKNVKAKRMYFDREKNVVRYNSEHIPIHSVIVSWALIAAMLIGSILMFNNSILPKKKL